MAIIIIWLCINAIVGAAIGARKNMVGGAIALSIFLGPIGWIIALVSEGDFRKCPFCAENIKDAALVCPHCQRDLPKKPAPPPSPPKLVVAAPAPITPLTKRQSKLIWITLGVVLSIAVIVIAAVLIYDMRDPADIPPASPPQEFVRLTQTFSVHSTNGDEIELRAGTRARVLLRYDTRLTIEYNGGAYPIPARLTEPAQ
jgi:hypothetical protein